jgi:hypothetical protein
VKQDLQVLQEQHQLLQVQLEQRVLLEQRVQLVRQALHQLLQVQLEQRVRQVHKA